MRDEPKKISVPCRVLFQLEHEAEDLEHALENMVEEVPSKFRKQLRKLSQEADHIRDELEHIKGLHWNPDCRYEPYN